MSSPVPVESTVPETASCSGSSSVTGRFGDLRGVQWRIDLGILPSSPSASVDDLRRLTANSRRRYAALRRQLLVDPHVPKDGSNSPDLVMDNPLSQNPDSMWGRFFRNAELERMVDQDLTRLYPERGSYFQTSGCQGILRRILLLWCLRHPEYGYRQGMHELLAPLLYVLHVDVERLSEVRKVYDDHFSDKFDGFSFHENDLTYKFDFKKFSEHVDFGNEFENSSSTLSELGPEIQNIVLLSDAYGAEGELGIVLSEKFMEHDAYSMFDALMSGAGGVISMADFFSPSPSKSSHSGYAPVIEASAAIYHLLSIVDISLHSHLIELGVEPQYFTLRWLRVLFGREFSLEDLLVTWDEIFARENAKKTDNNGEESNFAVLESPRGAFITAFAVSMILNMRSSLLATENATICLQRLLNFPDDVKLVKLLEKAKSLQAMAVNANTSNFPPIHLELLDGKKAMVNRGHTLSLDSSSPKTPLIVPESYWEEKWRVLHKEEEQSKVASEEQVPNRRKGWSERVKLRLSRTESDPTPGKKNERSKTAKPFVRRSLLDDLARQLGMDEDNEKTGFSEDVEPRDPVEIQEQDVIDESLDNTQDSVEIHRQDVIDESLGNTQDSVEIHGQEVIDENLDNTLSGEENSSNFSESPIHENSDDHENESGASSVASNSLIDENDAVSCGTNQDVDISSRCTKNDDQVENLEKDVKERKLLSGKFQWLWKFGRNTNDVTSDKKSESVSEDAKPGNGGIGQNSVSGVCAADGTNNRIDSSSGMSKGESVDQNLMGSLKNLGQSMLENIQVIEYVFQQDRGQMENLSKNGIVGKGQVTAMAALKELRKMSNLLSEM